MAKTNELGKMIQQNIIKNTYDKQSNPYSDTTPLQSTRFPKQSTQYKPGEKPGDRSSTIRMIKQVAKENNFDEKKALRIAECESTTGKNKKNLQGSSAEGLYQFMPKTFNAYCKGNIKNDSDQAKCFTNLNKKHPSWWECK